MEGKYKVVLKVNFHCDFHKKIATGCQTEKDCQILVAYRLSEMIHRHDYSSIPASDPYHTKNLSR